MALPALESMRPVLAASTPARALGTTASGAPLRMAFLYIPNGVNMKMWRPEGDGKNYKPGSTFEPLLGFRDEFQVFSGFEQLNANNGGDGPGDHARSSATFLTCARAYKTSGADIKLGISVDQVAARAMRDATRLPSLELSADGVRKSGNCDSGYSCAYQFNMSWRSEDQPMTPESNPRAVFERLFGGGGDKEKRDSLGQRLASRKSLLDFVSDDAKALRRHLGRNDQHKLDEYLQGVRDLERQIEKAEEMGNPVDPGVPMPDATPASYEKHLHLLADMMVLAFKTDSTRIGTLMLAHDGSNRSFKDIGVSEGHHSISHHKGQKDNLEKIAKIDRFYAWQLAYFLGKLRDTEDVDGKSLLHNSMIVYGGGISDGNRHNHDDLPIIVAGHAGGAFKPGRHVDFGGGVPLANLYLRMLEEFGMKERRFGDSTRSLREI
jgi:hypothetical protein